LDRYLQCLVLRFLLHRYESFLTSLICHTLFAANRATVGRRQNTQPHILKRLLHDPHTRQFTPTSAS
ncbi:MAG: hypothetical protein ACYS3N_23610, partial [Planctomycetota bacterium]